MPNVRFNLTNVTESNALIQAIFRYDNKRLVYSTKENINPVHWDKNKMRLKVTRANPHYEGINANLSKIETLIQKIHSNYQLNNLDLSLDKFKSELDHALGKSKKQNNTNLFDFIANFIENRQSIPTYSKGIIYKYKQLQDNMLGYAAQRKRKFDFEDIDLNFHDNFLKFLYSKGLAQNSAQKLIAILKTMLNEATERGVNHNIAFKSKKFNIPIEQVQNIYLDESELKLIYDLDLSNNPRLDRVRDLFLIGCYTGLRFSDFTSIEPENLTTRYGTDLINIVTKKTEQNVVIPMHPCTREILHKYKGVTPKPLSNQKMNDYIKEVAEKAGLTQEISITKNKGGKRIDLKFKKWELVTTHTARRSFATNAYKAGIPSLSIMKITGHKTESSFMKYIKITNEENAILMSQHKFFKS